MRKMLSVYYCAEAWCVCHARKTKRFMQDLGNGGMGTVEIIIIIAVLVALALLFKTFIIDMAENIFAKIQDKTDAAINDL